MFNFVQNFAAIGLLLQQGHLGEAFEYAPFQMIMLLVFMVFYPIAIYFSFLAYREFKAMLADNGMIGSGGMGN